ncbi:hypothetical protein L6164_011314 [Bauhinia variegata]|uniref:Uncharacterized protein n=1 Tax=Bauhinia variegata TaxID=167791 RepID=A0ACB9P5G5_BAUVA|nr:hypothetical protein L6164_011314 [Bauhinia variegata]
MSNSITTLSRRLCRSLLSIPKPCHQLSASFCTNQPSSHEDPESESDEFIISSEVGAAPDSASIESSPDSESSSSNSTQQRMIYDYPLENGVDSGIYKAILVGQVGQSPLQKTLKSGTVVTLLSLGTGGIRNNRRPLDNENPKEYANRCAVQWHRVSVYPQALGNLVMKRVIPGSLLYVEGNLETKVFSDPMSGLVRRIREVAVRRNGRIVFLGQGVDTQKVEKNELRAVGYY